MSLEIIKGIDNFVSEDRSAVATIGTFDGIHLGHQEILRRLMESSHGNGFSPLAITFEPHPRVIVTPHSPPLLLTCLEEKTELFARYMSGRMLVLEFNRDLMNLTAEEFTKGVLLDRIGIRKLIVGYDHAFGKNRSGNIEGLKKLAEKYSFELEVVPPVLVNDMPISSTRIRRLFENGDYDKAHKLLGHAIPIHGKVKRGISLGRKLGYPTANLEVHPRKLLPPDGVYACKIKVREKMYDGMMFIGKNHFNPEAGKSVEVNIFDFNEDIYDLGICCYPERFIRENRKFENTDRLVRQIEMDKNEVMKLMYKGE